MDFQVEHLLAAAGWLLGWLLLTRLPSLPPVESAGHGAPPVTVIIPARNEARSLGGLLDDLADRRPAGTRVVVVDDHSDDGTGDLARRYPFVQVMRAPSPGLGWTGKTNACWFAARQVPSGTLVFLDADIRIPGDALDRALAVHRHRGGLVSVWPFHTVERSYEDLSALFSVVAVMGTACGSPVRPVRPFGAFGPVLVVSSEDYRAVGGHRAVRGEVTEDFAFAEIFRAEARPVAVFGGHRQVTFRMYPNGPRSAIEGWTRNLGGAAPKIPKAMVLAIALWLTGSMTALPWAGGGVSWALAALFAVQMGWFFRQLGDFGLWNVLLYPLHTALFCAVFLRALFQTFVLRRVTWRGRPVRVRVSEAEVAAGTAGDDTGDQPPGRA